MSEARDEKPLVVEMLSSSCCEMESLISFTREKLEVEAPAKGPPKGLPKGAAVEVEGWGNSELERPASAGEPSSEAKCRWERLRGGRDRTSWKFSDARLVEGSGSQKSHYYLALQHTHTHTHTHTH